MAQSVKIAGALFSNVPSIQVPDQNDVYHGFFDVSDTTATASDVASGKYFYTAAGVRTAGTASGGGGGLEYEIGEYKPTSNVARPTIDFQNTHTDLPVFVMIVDRTNDHSTETYTNYFWSYINYYTMFGAQVPYSSSEVRYGQVTYAYRSDGTSSTIQGTLQINSLGGPSSSSGLKHWLSTTAFTPGTNSSSRYWRANRTYKWIAVWAPAS